VLLFFHVLHFFFIHLLAVGACLVRFGSVGGLFQSPDPGHFPFTAPPGWAANLPDIYLLWAVVILALYPLCRWYAGLKRRRKACWLSYLGAFSKLGREFGLVNVDSGLSSETLFSSMTNDFAIHDVAHDCAMQSTGAFP
jgi:hypothetical protein